ncbi:MAG: alpha/beta fold hydrolase [Fimbriimonadaceae bacterium]|nr:alpha/beta fold hydrolase [Fimbriimonadaceae bacterium]
MESPDRSLYPFNGRWHRGPDGRQHYLDEGSGDPVLMVHGTPTWSFMYRNLVLGLMDRHRCVAPDHLGHGLSDKPSNADYRPEAHAARLMDLVETLELRDITLVVHDFGGPIGMDCVLRSPDRFKRVLVSNTWMWPLDDPRLKTVDKVVNGALGRFLYLKMNASVKAIMPSLFANRRLLTRTLHRQYLAPYPSAADREPLIALARSLKGSSDMYANLWQNRDAILRKTTAVLWGEKDPSFPGARERWQGLLPGKVETLAESGHFVWEESPDACLAFVQRSLTQG